MVFYNSVVSFFKKIWCFNLKKLQHYKFCLVTNPSNVSLCCCQLFFDVTLTMRFDILNKLTRPKFGLIFPLNSPRNLETKNSLTCHTMNVDDDQVFWFFEEPLKNILKFLLRRRRTTKTFNKGKPRGSRHMFSQSHLACFLGGLFCSVVAERKVMEAFILGL